MAAHAQESRAEDKSDPSEAAATKDTKSDDSSSLDTSAKKDTVLFITEEEASKPSSVVLPDTEDGPPGLIMPNGEINWNCPCLGGMAVGPCGVEFRDAFSCFHYSTADPKGSDCLEKFSEMQNCMQNYPDLYEEKKGKFVDDEGEEPAAPKDDLDATSSAATETPSEQTQSDDKDSSTLTASETTSKPALEADDTQKNAASSSSS